MVEWKYTTDPVGIDEIGKAEKAMGVKFPKDYVECAKTNHQGHPSPDKFDCEKRKGLVFNYLYSLKEGDSDYIVDVYKSYQDGRMEKGLVPFADDPGGDEICFDYRKDKNNPSVVYWDHEIAFDDPEGAISYVCDSFSDLIEKLYE